MKKDIVKIMKQSEATELNILDIKAKLLLMGHKSEEIKKSLEKNLYKLELDGKIYGNSNGTYQLFPSNFFVKTINYTKKGKIFIEHNDSRIFLDDQEHPGVLNFDRVVLEIENGKVKIQKVLKRVNPTIMCEVIVNSYGLKKLKLVGDTKSFPVVIDKDIMKKLVPGTRIMVETTNMLHGEDYVGQYIKTVGNKMDFNTDLLAIAINNGFICGFSDEIMNEVDKIPSTIENEDLSHRVDLRDEEIFTIDGAHTKDIDDAVSIRLLGNGHYQLTVSIADVAHYVKYGSKIWERAEANTTSLYLVDYVNAMLPHELSSGICSLNPNEERLSRSFILEINQNGDVVDGEIVKSVIKSQKKMTYDDVNKILEEGIVPEGYEPFVDSLLMMQDLSKILTRKKQSLNAISINNKEVQFDMSEQGDILGIQSRSQRTAEHLIENFMVTTNEYVGTYYMYILNTFVYRNHDYPDVNKIARTLKLFNELGYKMKKIDKLDEPQVLNSIIRKLRDKEEFVVLSGLILKSLQKAYYGNENIGHYGLGIDNAYSQTTSPIRRFTDLVIHSIMDGLDNILTGKIDFEEYSRYLQDICQRASEMERCSDKAEYEADKLFMCDYMSKFIGEEFVGFVSDITSSGIKVKLENLVDGYINIVDVKDRKLNYNDTKNFFFDDETFETIKVGSKISVTLKRVDRDVREIFFDINELNLQREQTKEKPKTLTLEKPKEI